jgi:hypothetical protein
MAPPHRIACSSKVVLLECAAPGKKRSWTRAQPSHRFAFSGLRRSFVKRKAAQRAWKGAPPQFVRIRRGFRIEAILASPFPETPPDRDNFPVFPAAKRTFRASFLLDKTSGLK